MARLMPIQQLVIKSADTTSLSFKEIAVVGCGTNRMIVITNIMAMKAKRSERMTSLVGLKSIS
jgi:hypothetical protein